MLEKAWFLGLDVGNACFGGEPVLGFRRLQLQLLAWGAWRPMTGPVAPEFCDSPT